jgi:8-oxo-dGTP diphosphatase
MICKIHKLNELVNYKYVVVLSKYKGQILLSRHKDRSTWETQGGHIEADETPYEAAVRELFEEAGAVKFNITPAFDYFTEREDIRANGMVFKALIVKLAVIPDREMAEVRNFSRLPAELTYPEITPLLFEYALKNNML